MRYRYNYDYLFVPSENILVGDKIITDLAVYLEFRVFYDGEEVFFYNNDDVYFKAEGESVYLRDTVRGVFDKDSMFRFEPTALYKHLEDKGYKILYKISDYSWGVGVNECVSDGEVISKELFESIFRDNIELFDNTNNVPAQGVAFYATAVD